MLPAVVRGDRFGRKRVMIGALALFGAGSIGCLIRSEIQNHVFQNARVDRIQTVGRLV